ncbi:oligosaccharide flippase family protein [Catalinimonas niigatensis]|uniref:oligosaccharide flippase family protein n=1 Tax=Catalinimonas niigatensis TaxID=1397264 RepID=UPI00266528BF|nr:oligosaccharide flippase family protein [Catalinimonas niigatensis]WPP48362.1 oligosaccharide flippase family protein [Catalinimonas niigatensis]
MKTTNVKILNSIGWVTVSSFGKQGIRLLIKLVLARLLLPEHYGLIGMATIFAGLVSLIGELGIEAALFDTKTQQRTQ